MLLLKSTQLINLINIVLGILCSKSVLITDIGSELGDFYTDGLEESKLKRIYRFFTNERINAERVYDFFATQMLRRYKPWDKKLIIIFDHTTIEDRFTILQFSMRIGTRAIPLWYKMFKYDDKNNKQFIHVKEGLLKVYEMIKAYNFEVIVLADRGFKSVDLFNFIDEKLKWKYCIRCTKDVYVKIENKIMKLQDIKPLKKKTKYYNGVKLTEQEYTCNLAICKDEESLDTWFLIHNFESNIAVNEYKKRFTIEEMFKDFKKGGFNLESTWTENLTYARNLYLCISIAYTWMITLGISCTKDKNNKILGVMKKIKGKKVRIFSLFRTGLMWFKRCLNSSKNKIFLKFDIIIYGF